MSFPTQLGIVAIAFFYLFVLKFITATRTTMTTMALDLFLFALSPPFLLVAVIPPSRV